MESLEVTSRLFPSKELFELNGRLLRLLPEQSDRLTLSRRVESYLRSRRRGKFRLPVHFPSEVQAFSKLTKSQLRKVMYWVKPNHGIHCRLNKSTMDHASRYVPGMLWSCPENLSEHCVNTVDVARLCATDWPRITRNQWPSTPSISELLEMSRRGISVPPQDKLPITVDNCARWSDLSNDIRFASKLVAKNIIGIRSSVGIKDEFRPWFRYRNGFLILTVRYNLPAGLVRFLLGQWKVAPFNLWLKEKCRLKIFLRRQVYVEPKLDIEYEESSYQDSSPLVRGMDPDSLLNNLLNEEPDEEWDPELAALWARLPA